MNALVKIDKKDPGVIEGEILYPEETISFWILESPVTAIKRNVRIPSGLTLSESLNLAMKATSARFPKNVYRIYLGQQHDLIPKELWDKIRVKPGVTVVAKPVARDFISPLIALIGGAISGLSGLVGSFGLLGKILMAGVSMGLKYLLSNIFAPKQQDNRLPEPKVSYSIAGSRNQMDRFGVVPVILGTHRDTPNLGASPYTEVYGDEQYIRMLFIVGYGPMSITDLQIGETPIANYDDVDYEINQGFAVSTASSIYPQQVIEESLNIELEYNVVHMRETAENVNYITVDIVWPNGVIWVDNKGTRRLMGTGVRIQYRVAGSGSGWTTIADIFYELATQDTLRRSYSVSVPSGQYEVRVYRTAVHVNDAGVIDSIHWIGLKGFRTGAPLAFPEPLTTISVRIRGTSQLNGVIDTLNCKASALVRKWNGSTWVADQASSNPADLYRHVLQHRANAARVTDTQIDLDTVQAWADYCTTSGWTYDKVIKGRLSVLEILFEICAAGRATPVWRDGKWSVVWDEAATPVAQMFTTRNSWGFEGTHNYQDIPHAFRMPFVNASKNYIEDERIVYDDGYTQANATKFAQLVVPGVTNSNNIWKHGRYHIASMRLRPAQYSLFTDFEGLILVRNDRIRVQHDVMLVGLGSFRVKDVDDTVDAHTVTVDDAFVMDSGTTYAVRFRLKDGTFVTRTVVPGTGGELYVIPLSGAGSLPEVGDLGAWGESGIETGEYRVVAIEPQEDHIHKITFVDYASAIYDADTGTIPEFASNVQIPVDPFTLGPRDLRLTGGVEFNGTQFFEYINSSWVLVRSNGVDFVSLEYKAIGDATWTPKATLNPAIHNYRLSGLLSGSYQVRVKAFFTDGTTSDWTTSEIFLANSLQNPPADVTNFRIAIIGDIATLSWTPVIDAGATYEIRFSPESVSLPSWNTATPLFTSIQGSSIQTQTMIGTYFIKAYKTSGAPSANAASIITGIDSLTGLNVVEVITENPYWIGLYDDAELIDEEVRLIGRNVMALWDPLSEVDTLAFGTGDADSLGYVIEGYYYFVNNIDLGEVYTSRITAAIDAYGFDPHNVMASWTTLASLDVIDDTDPSEWGVELQYRATNDAPIDDNWSAWQTVFVGDVTARALQFRIKLTGKRSPDIFNEYAMITPSVKAVSVNVDMPDRIEAAEDVVVSGSGLTISFLPPYMALRGVAISAQGMATGDYYEITNKDEEGFDIIFKNSAGTGVSRTFDWLAKGYGRQA